MAATIGISAYLVYKMPFAWMHLIPANIGVLASIYPWRKPPKRKKARKAAAATSLVVVPFIFATAALSLLYSPVAVWVVFLSLTALALMVAIIAIVNIERKNAHVWSDYYADLG